MMRPLVQDGAVALAECTAADLAALDQGWDGAFDVDKVDGAIPEPFGLTNAAVLLDGVPVGSVGWHQVQWGPSRGCGAWNMGIELLPTARGRGVGSTALRLLAGHLFTVTDLDRVEASTDVDNVAARRAIEAAGLRREGIVRGAQLRGGRRRDLVLHAMLRSDLA